MNDLIDKREERTRKRKAVKRKMDSVIGLSVNDTEKHHAMSLSNNPIKLADKTIRLLDEGYIDNGFVIKKGTMEKFLNGQNQYVRGWEFDGEEWHETDVLNLNDDFVGTVNIGHQDFSTFPFLVGEWTRKDLSLVETENDRHGIDVRLNLDEDSIFVKELQRKPYDIGVSAEFWYHINEADTESLSEMLGYFMPVLDEIFIFAYGLVGECGNVNSSGLELAKENTMPNEEIKTNLEELEIGMVDEPAELDSEVVAVEEETADMPHIKELDDVNIRRVVETPTEELNAEEEAQIPPTEEETEEVNEADEEAEEEPTVAEEEEVEEAEVEEVADDESVDDEDESDEDNSLAETLKAFQSQIDTLTNRVVELEQQNTALKKTNRKLSNKLQSEKQKKDEFIENIKGLSVALLPNEENEQKPKEEKVSVSVYANGDGITDL